MKRLSLILLCIVIALSFAACGKSEKSSNKTTITVAASSAPHAEILEKCKDVLKEKGYKLDIKIMDDYVVPNTATESGDVDANFFQHTPYLEQFNSENGTHLVPVLKVHYEPYGIYAGRSSSLEKLPDKAKIAVPNDATNEARALMLLDACGLIKLKDSNNLAATKADITENKHNYEIVEMEAALLPSILDEVAVAVINGNYAISSGLKVSEALATEDADSAAAQTYGNIVVVKEGNENSEKIKALTEAITSDEIRDFINGKYDKAVIPLF